MNGKFKTHLIGLAVALGAVAVGFTLGGPPSQPFSGPAQGLALTQATAVESPPLAADRAARRGALRRHLALPYVSLPTLLPSKES